MKNILLKQEWSPSTSGVAMYNTFSEYYLMVHLNPLCIHICELHSYKLISTYRSKNKKHLLKLLFIRGLIK